VSCPNLGGVLKLGFSSSFVPISAVLLKSLLPEAIYQHTSCEVSDWIVHFQFFIGVSVGLRFIQIDLQFLWIAGFFESKLGFLIGIDLPRVLPLHVFLLGAIEPIGKRRRQRLPDHLPDLIGANKGKENRCVIPGTEPQTSCAIG
jgi:hypothetical protein